MKNSNDSIGDRTRDLPTCSAVYQSTAPPRAPVAKEYGRQMITQLIPLLLVSLDMHVLKTLPWHTPSYKKYLRTNKEFILICHCYTP